MNLKINVGKAVDNRFWATVERADPYQWFATIYTADPKHAHAAAIHIVNLINNKEEEPDEAA